jgi:hypothetical protein
MLTIKDTNKILNNADYILSQKVYKKGFITYSASEDLLLWVDRNLSTSNIFEGVDLINTVLKENF